MHYVVKVIIFWNTEYNCLCIYQLDANTALGTNKGVAKTLDFSLEKIDFNGSRIILYSCSIDVRVVVLVIDLQINFEYQVKHVKIHFIVLHTPYMH